MKFIVQFSFVCASLLYRYFICILTLFLELMYLRLSKWATMFSLSITVIYFSNVNDHFVSHPFTDYLPISICIVIVLADWHTTASIWQDFDDLFATVTFLLENSSGAVFITTYHNRRYQRIISHPCLLLHLEEVWQAPFLINYLTCWICLRSGHHLIEFLMVKWGLKCLKLLDGFSFLPPCKAASLQGNIQLVEIVLDKEKHKWLEVR